MLAAGRLHLSGIAKLVPHLTPENRDALLERAAHRTKREIEELIASLAPRPDVPARVRKLPQPGRAVPARAPQPTPERARSRELGPDRVVGTGGAKPAPPPVVEPLAPFRYRVQFTRVGVVETGRLLRLARDRAIACAVRRDNPERLAAANALLIGDLVTAHSREPSTGDLPGIRERGR